MLTRHELRKEGLMILFRVDFYGEEFNMSELDEYKGEGRESVLFANLYLENEGEVDLTITENLVNYTIKRLNIVDRSILRLATSELMYSDTPVNIIINEALKLTDELSDLGDKKQVRFNNSVLDKIAKTVRK